MKRYFTRQGVHPFEEIEWVRRDVSILNERGNVVFKQNGVEAPVNWSPLALQIVSSKYFNSTLKENSVKALLQRVASTIKQWGVSQKYFSVEEALIFEAELLHLLVHQKMSFNSPVWFNVGVSANPQSSACFINAVEDSIGSILDLAKTETLLFKQGSGSGTNFSTIRSAKEPTANGGQASGPLPFIKALDMLAGAIKSGGKTRRAAKMVILDVTHPDIVKFIRAKEIEEQKIAPEFFQNANHSVRVSNTFMQAVEKNEDWHTLSVIRGSKANAPTARELIGMMAQAAWACGDPGVQFDDTINAWHTCPQTDRIYASNPCSEFMFLNNTACNLASLNLMKFTRDGYFDVPAFTHAIQITLLAQEILIDNSGYPTNTIARNSHDYRPLGLGYANLGGLLMAWGIPYDSDEARSFAASMTALMTGEAYKISAEIARQQGAFTGFAKNREAMLNVIQKHMHALEQIPKSNAFSNITQCARLAWKEALSLGQTHGYRNAQVTVIAPTGTIALMMDCDTTGIEPELALIKQKQLYGGGTVTLVNQSALLALERLGYTAEQRDKINSYILQHGHVEGAPFLKTADLAAFDCALSSGAGQRTIHYKGHLNMMSAVQPFVSGAISKTVNLPQETPPAMIEKIYMEAWHLGLKSIAIYRDGSKRTQPLSTGIVDTIICNDCGN